MNTTITYPFNSILINGREVTLHSITSETAQVCTEFEGHTFDFIRQWLTDCDNFSIATSGSTGNPKIISITRAQMKASAKMTIEFLGLGANETALACLNTKYIAGRMMLVRAFEAGMRIIAQEPSSNPLLNISAPIDFVAFVPLQAQSILEAGDESVQKFNKIKNILIGGGVINGILRKEIKNTKSSVFATYGMTETISHIALQKLNGNSITERYHTLPGIDIQKDERDCLMIKAPYLSDTIVTNDIVNIKGDHEFQWLGRWDNIINTGGIKISPETLEGKMSTIINEYLTDINFFVHGLPDEHLGDKIILVMETGKKIDASEILSVLRESLPKYEVPKTIITIPKFSYTNTGKINRKETIKLGI